MRTILLDGKLILTFLTGDDPDKQTEAKELFSKGESGEVNIIVKPITALEVCKALETGYGVSRQKIAEKMQVFLSQKWMEIADRKALLNLWDDYAVGNDFADSFLSSWARMNKAEYKNNSKEVSRS